MRIRIGTDVNLTLSLNEKTSQDLNIISAKAYVINRTAKEYALNQKKRIDQFIARFPVGRDIIDPKLSGLLPDEHNIHMLGKVPYHCYPREYVEQKFQSFGPYPHWDKKYIPVVEEYDMTSYAADVMFTEDRGVIKILYPAEALFFTGDYDVVVVAQVYCGGYPNNTKTITVDFTDQFTLIPGEVPPPIPEWVLGDELPAIFS